jgi:hypothetical protein
MVRKVLDFEQVNIVIENLNTQISCVQIWIPRHIIARRQPTLDKQIDIRLQRNRPRIE